MMQQAEAKPQHPGLIFKTEDRDAAHAGAVALGKLYDSRRGLGGFYRYLPRKMEDLTNDAANPGDQVMVGIFNANELVHIVGTSKGRGFAGFVKRHHFRGGDDTHGSMFHRAPGSIGASSFPSRVFPGMRMSGHMGAARVTVRNLEVVEVDAEDNTLLVKGAVPGPNGGYVVVRRSKR